MIRQGGITSRLGIEPYLVTARGLAQETKAKSAQPARHVAVTKPAQAPIT